MANTLPGLPAYISRADVMRILNERRAANASVGAQTQAFLELTRAARDVEKLETFAWPVPIRDKGPEPLFEYFVQEAHNRDELREYIQRHALHNFRPVGGVAVSTSSTGHVTFFQAMSRESAI